MAEAKLWKVINMSDPYTLRCDDFLVAAAATLVLGEGRYGLECVNDESESRTLPLFLFRNADPWLAETFGNFGAFLDTHKPEIAEALESVMSFGVEERRAYDLAIEMLPPESRDAYRAKIHDANRSSLNDIGAYAWGLAKRLRETNSEVHRG